jgi:tetraacyldisaccharide 4'-kinase
MRTPEFWKEHDLTARFAVAVLSPIALLYGANVAWKAAHARPVRAKAKVICVGNLTVGGSGKTPVAIAIARTLSVLGRRPVFLSRGYGGRMKGPCFIDPSRNSAADAGDEPLLLASAAPVIVSRDRAAGASLADAEEFDTIVMDDGHQNFALAKDLSIVVIDAQTGFGNGRIVPAGPLRERVAQGLARATAVVLVGEGAPNLEGFSGPILRARLVPCAGVQVRGEKVLAFAGIGRPDKFFATLRALGAELVESRDYADHHAYSASEVARLKARARGQDALLITTEKDYVRLAPIHREGISMLPVEARFDDPQALVALLANPGAGSTETTA